MQEKKQNSFQFNSKNISKFWCNYSLLFEIFHNKDLILAGWRDISMIN